MAGVTSGDPKVSGRVEEHDGRRSPGGDRTSHRRGRRGLNGGLASPAPSAGGDGLRQTRPRALRTPGRASRGHAAPRRPGRSARGGRGRGRRGRADPRGAGVATGQGPAPGRTPRRGARIDRPGARARRGAGRPGPGAGGAGRDPLGPRGAGPGPCRRRRGPDDGQGQWRRRRGRDRPGGSGAGVRGGGRPQRQPAVLRPRVGPRGARWRRAHRAADPEQPGVPRDRGGSLPLGPHLPRPGPGPLRRGGSGAPRRRAGPPHPGRGAARARPGRGGAGRARRRPRDVPWSSTRRCSARCS